MKNIKTILIVTLIILTIIAHEWWKYGYEKRIETSMAERNYAEVDKSSAHGSSIWTPWTFIKTPVVDLKFVSKKFLPVNDTIMATNVIHTKFGEENDDFLLLFNTSQQTCTTINEEERIKQFLQTKQLTSDLQWDSLAACDPWVAELYTMADIIQNGPLKE